MLFYLGFYTRVIIRIEIELKKENIDILAIINKSIYIFITSKRHNTKCSSKLSEYTNNVKYYAYIYPEDEINYKHILSKNYKVIDRKDLIKLIKPYKDKDDILKNITTIFGK